MLLEILKRNKEKFHIPNIEKPLFCSRCIEYPYVEKDGYGLFQFRDMGIKQRIRAHRAAFMLYFNCQLSSEEVIMHTCDNRACVNPSHLKLGTTLLNVKDRVEKKRSALAEKNGRFTHGKYVGRYKRLRERLP